MTVSLSKNNVLLAEVKAIDTEIAKLQAHRAAKVASLAASVRNMPGKVILDTGSFTVSENNTYDEAVMRENMLPGQVRRCTVPKLDKATVKRLYPAVYAKAQKKNGVKVSVG